MAFLLDFSVAAFLFSFGAVVLAEMGDKTQLLAIAFAAKYKAHKVMIGVFAATIINHALAVIAGNIITRFESIQIIIQVLASLSFIFFGLWTIRGDKLEGEENKTSRFGAVITVGIAFFIAEMGDKTQLTTIALAAKFPGSPLGILTGTTTGMLVADGIGIIVGSVLKKTIPEQQVKIVSAIAFIIFGLIGTAEILYVDFKFPVILTAASIIVLAALTFIAARYIMYKEKSNEN